MLAKIWVDLRGHGGKWDYPMSGIRICPLVDPPSDEGESNSNTGFLSPVSRFGLYLHFRYLKKSNPYKRWRHIILKYFRVCLFTAWGSYSGLYGDGNI